MLASNIQLAPSEMLSLQTQSAQGSSGFERAESSFDVYLKQELVGATDGQKNQTDTYSHASTAQSESHSIEESRASESNKNDSTAKTDSSQSESSRVEEKPGEQSEISENKEQAHAKNETDTDIAKSVHDENNIDTKSVSEELIKKAKSLKNDTKEDAESLQTESVLSSAEDSSATMLRAEVESTDAQAEVAKIDAQPIGENIGETVEMSASAEQEMQSTKAANQQMQDPTRANLAEIPAIAVKDLRTSREEGRGDSGLQTTVQIDKNGNAEMTVNLSAHANGQNGRVDGSLAKNGMNFTNMLSQEIKANANEFVKTGSIVLRNNNMGSINMILHPEELGNVKIQLELADKVVTGKIVVESLEAYNAFKSNLQTLKTAFAESGLSTAGFELSWSGSESNSENGHGEHREQNPHGRFYSDLIPTMSSESGNEVIATGYGFSAINVIA